MSPGSKNNSAEQGRRRFAAKKSTLWLRARILQAIRRYFVDHDYLEVETPHLIPAPAPEIHIDAIRAEDAFLHTSPELCMKRLLSAGYDKVFQICRCFREGERGEHHLYEFTLLEWYRAGVDYVALMDECEEMILSVSHDLGFGKKITYQERDIELKKPWERIAVKEAFMRYAPITMEKALELNRFDEVMVSEIEPRLGIPKPTFLYDYPLQVSPLAKKKPGEPRTVERFEFFIGGVELGNAFSEINDPLDQRERFVDSSKALAAGDQEAHPLDEDYINALSYGMPPTGGFGMGVDRLTMLFTGKESLREVILFPHLRAKD